MTKGFFPPLSARRFLVDNFIYAWWCYSAVLISFYIITAISSRRLDLLPESQSLSEVRLSESYLLSSLLLAPILEALPILLLHLLFIGNHRRNYIFVGGFIASVFTFAYFFHGGKVNSIPLAVGFLFLAILFDKNYKLGIKRATAYLGIVITHVIWNIASLLTVVAAKAALGVSY